MHARFGALEEVCARATVRVSWTPLKAPLPRVCALPSGLGLRAATVRVDGQGWIVWSRVQRRRESAGKALTESVAVIPHTMAKAA